MRAWKLWICTFGSSFEGNNFFLLLHIFYYEDCGKLQIWASFIKIIIIMIWKFYFLILKYDISFLRWNFSLRKALEQWKSWGSLCPLFHYFFPSLYSAISGKWSCYINLSIWHYKIINAETVTFFNAVVHYIKSRLILCCSCLVRLIIW